MRRTTTTIGLLTAGLLLTACTSSSNGGRPDDTATPPATTAATPSVDTAGLIAACKTAIAAGLDTGSGAPQCKALSKSDYLKALHAVDADAQKAFKGDTDEMACYDALKAQYEPGTARLTGAPTEPPACLGLPTDRVSEIATAVLEGQTGG